jgi:hypothetical protein
MVSSLPSGIPISTYVEIDGKDSFHWYTGNLNINDEILMAT